MPTMRNMGELADVLAPRAYLFPEFAGELSAVLAGRATVDRVGPMVRVDGRRVLVDRLFRELQAVPAAERAGRIVAHVDAALQLPTPSWADAQPWLRSVLRPASYTNAVTDDADRPWLRRLWPFVHEVAVLDTGAVRRVVTQSDTDAWGVRGAEMFAVARGNIAALYPPQPQAERIGQLLGDGISYCDSAVLVPGWLGSFADGPGPRSLVFFPGDEVLLVCTEDAGVAPAFFDAAERVYREAVVPISPQAYTVVGETIVPLDAAGPGPLRPWAMRARSVLAATEYETQAERLIRDHAAALHADLGAVQLIDTPAGVRTLTAWRQGSDWLLPVTDYVMLMPEAGAQFVVPAGVLGDIVGVTDAGILPPRYAVAGWPGEAELAALRAHAVGF